MKCECIKTCQRNIVIDKETGAKATKFFNVGDIWEFDECPRNFVKLDSETIDLATASIEALLEADLDPVDVMDYLKENHPSVKVHPNTGITKLIDKLVYARDNDSTIKSDPVPSHKLDSI